MEKKPYFLGLDIGTDSVGYAAADSSYSLMKFKGEAMWGTTLFENAQLNTKRRMARTARRQLDRRKQRVQLIQELFAHEIQKVDPRFYIRIHESQLCRDEAESANTLFDDVGFTDKDYYKAYPTIHHLIEELMTSSEPHDVRLVYWACAWLVAHRGHFLSEISKENIAGFTDFDNIWNGMVQFIETRYDDVVIPWDRAKEGEIPAILAGKTGVTQKNKQLCSAIFSKGKAPKEFKGFPFNCDELMKAICGGKIDAQKLFINEEYKEIKFSLGEADEKIEGVLAELGDDGQLIQRLKAIYDWSVLVELLAGEKSISAAKVEIYNQHKRDLRDLKYIVRKYLPEKYDALLNEASGSGYAAYTGHCTKEQRGDLKEKATKEAFSKSLEKTLKDIRPEEEDRRLLDEIKDKLANQTFLPKQRDTDNRVIPHQLYWYELNALLQRACEYLPFLRETDVDGISVSEKILSVFLYRIPYYVGPLNANSQFAWIQRKAQGRILPWNFEKMVDLDLSEQEFIRRMTNTCTYLPDCEVLPRESLLYQRFTVLNEINNIKIDGNEMDVSVKQAIYRDLFEQKRRVSLKMVSGYLVSNGYMTKDQSLSGVDTEIRSNLKSYHDFRRLLDSGTLTEKQVEDITERITYTEDKLRLKRYLRNNFSTLNSKDIDYIARLNYKDFGRLSAQFLTSFEGTDAKTGKILTISLAMWETNCNLMELLSDRYTFAANVEGYQREIYAGKKLTLDQRLTQMRLSNAVKRPVLRALEITKEVTKAIGAPPQKFFIEMTRGALPDQKNRRTLSRKQQLQNLYKECQDEDIRELASQMGRQLEELGEAADSRLQGNPLFLYYVQLGRCMYSGKSIDLNQLAGNTYNIEHIFPRAYVKDDSIINNEVLVLSELNGQKLDTYPIRPEIRQKMTPFWTMLKKNHLLSDEKYKRLTRSTPFSDDEKLGFINRQLTETSQSAKALATLLKEQYPDSEVVYVKAHMVSEFREKFKLFKSRTFNDLHHAKDAYLNIVVGNVYDMRFNKSWFSVREKYNVKPEVLYKHPVICNGAVVWDGEAMLEKVKKIVSKNTAHMTPYAFCRKSGQNGGLFDQNLQKAKPGLIPRKKGMPTEKYGGYNKATISFFIPVRYVCKKKADIMVMAVELLHANRFMADDAFALEYASRRLQEILGKPVSQVSFPMGMRIWKINTMLSLDGLRVCIAGSSEKGTKLVVKTFMPFAASVETETYVKKLESLVKKVKENKNYVFDARFDKVTAEKNGALYDLYIEKLKNTVYAKRPNNQLELLEKNKARFDALSPVKQANVLLNIQMVFGRVSGGVDLSAIGGGPCAAATTINSAMSNWKKKYKEVRMIDISASGIWEKQSENLLNLL